MWPRAANRRPCDLNALIADVASAAQARERVDVETDLAGTLPNVIGDPIAFRRILENLTANAVDSLHSTPGRITVSTQVVDRIPPRPCRRRVARVDVYPDLSARELGRRSR